LELINGFEVFYKTSIIRLAECIQPYIDPDSLKGTVDAKVLLHANLNTSSMALIFEKNLFHDLKSVNEATASLIGQIKYTDPNAKNMKKLRAVFQLRHTLSHNSGLVTQSDATKFKILGYTVTAKEAIDPASDDLDIALSKFLSSEAEAFTKWISEKTRKYLSDSGYKISIQERDNLIKYFGENNAFWRSITVIENITREA
jgi:hypothetical protein